MGGKNKDQDPFADFFGDDVDWLDDEDQGAKPEAEPPPPTLPPQPAPEIASDAPASEPEPVAAQPLPAPVPPPPPPPLRPPRTDFVAAPAESEAAALSEPLPLPIAPTERSAVDDTIGVFLEPITRPDGSLPSDDGPPPEELETVTDHPGSGLSEPADIFVEEDDPAEIDVASRESLNAQASAPADATVTEAPSSEAAPDAASLVDDASDAASEPPSESESDSEPPPEAADEPSAEAEPAAEAASDIDADAAAQSQPRPLPAAPELSDEVRLPGQPEPLSPEPAVIHEDPATADAEASAPALAPWSPTSGESAWVELCEPLEDAAASASDPQTAAALLIEAARIRRDHLGQLDIARDLLDRAAALVEPDPVLLRASAETATRMGDFALAASVIAQRAESLQGAPAAEAWQAAALIARHRLREVERTEEYLQRATQADPSDYASLSLLRDILSVKGREADRARALSQLSSVATGRVAAEAWWELGRLHLALDEPERARDAFAQGRGCDPAHAQCFLALQALHAHLGDDVALGELFVDEASREGQTDPGHWAIEAARAFVDARDTERADKAFELALEHGHPLAAREQQAWFIATGRQDAYAAALAAEVEQLSEGPERAFALYRLGWVREQDLGDLDGAIEAYRACVQADPAAGPAAEAVARSLLAAGRYEELLEFWQGRAERTDDLTVRGSVLLRMAEVAEARLGDEARARTCLEQLLAVRPDDRTALEALRRIYRRLQAWPELATVYETLATLDAEDPELAAQHLSRAGNVWRYEAQDLAQARDCYQRALGLRAAHAIALDEQVDLLEGLGEWGEQATILRRAADVASSEADRVRFAYRAGRVWLDRLDDAPRAAEAFRLCLRYDPSHLPALGMLKQIAARAEQGQEIYRLFLQQAQSLSDPGARHWRLLAAADLAERLPGGDPSRDLGAILDREPSHPGAIAAQELRLLSLGAKVGLLNLYRRVTQDAPAGPTRAALLLRLVNLYEALGDEAGIEGPLQAVVDGGYQGIPARAVARIAESRRLWPLAVRALEIAGQPEDRLERARLLTVRLKQPDEALALYRDLLSEPTVAVGAALGAAALAQRAGDAALLYQAHATLAEHGGTEPVRAAHGLWSGQLAEADGQPERALEHYLATLELRPSSLTAFDGARRILLAGADADGLRGLWSAARPEDPHGLALDLEQVGDRDGAIEVWGAFAQADDAGLGPLTQYEAALTRAERWREVYAVATRRAALVSSAEHRATIDAKRRWILAEKLYETDEAWELYQSLHEENPDDREVTSALARIAMARGERRLAIGFLEHLTHGASSPDEAATLRVRVAEVHEHEGSTDEARQALLDALDHVRDHEGALAGLKRLAQASQDWSALADVLALEASRVTGERRIAALRELARLRTEHGDDPAVAAESWQAVLDESADDAEALQAALSLAEQRGSHDAVVDLAVRLAEVSEGEVRTRLLSQAGRLALDELEQPEASGLLERALSEGPLDVAAAERLTSLYRSRGDRDAVIRVLGARAQATEEPIARGALLAEAGGIERDRGRRDEAADLYRAAIEHAPDHRDALLFLSEYLFERGQTAGALPVYERLAPTVEQGQDLDDFDVRLELSTFFYRLCRMLADQGRAVDAIAAGDRALTYNPTHQPTLEIVAPLLVDQQAWKRANDALRQLVQLTAGQGDRVRLAGIYARLGQVERALGRADKARKHLDKSLGMVPNFVPALQAMAALHEDAGQWTQLLDVFNNVISHATQPADVTGAYLTKGRVLDEQMARPDKAAQHYERSLAYDANQPGVLLRLAELAWRRGDFDEAAARAQLGLEISFQPSPLRADLHVCLAAARASQGDAERAAQALAKAREDDPTRELSDAVLDDLEALRVAIRARLPR